MNEFDLIDSYFAPLAGPEGLGLKDDAARVKIPDGFELVMSTDTMVEGIHFPAGQFDDLIAQRLLRVNLSDLAAKAATPRGYQLSIALPSHIDSQKVGLFADGLRAVQNEFGLRLWGGDTVSTRGPIVLTISIYGVCPEGLSPKRSGARVGDDIWMTGFPGKGRLGLWEVEGQKFENDYSRYFYKPVPQINIQKILRSYAGSSIDVSDGFAADMEHIATESQVLARIKTGHMYFPAEIKKMIQDRETLKTLLSHGDDYEVIFTAPAVHRKDILKAAEIPDVYLSRIGQCDEGTGVEIYDGTDLLSFDQKGFRHF